MIGPPMVLDDEFPGAHTDAFDETHEPHLLDERQLPPPTHAIEAPEPTPPFWVVQDLFTAGDVGLVVGDGGSFKSAAALHIAAAVAGGYKAFDRFDVARAPVLFVSAEDPGSVIQMRLEAFVRGHDWNRFMVLENVFYFAMAGVQLNAGGWKKHLLDTARTLNVGLIVLDPFVDLSGLEEENSNSEAIGVMRYARMLARELNCVVIFVHHANKSSEGRTQARIRGAGAIANASRSTLFFEFTEAGVMVEQVKMTYAQKVPPFMLTRDIHSEPANRAQWITARLATVKPEDARLSRAEEFVLAQIVQSPGALNSRAIREASKGSGIWGSDVDRAVKALFAKHLIYYEDGPAKAKIWHPVRRTNGTHPVTSTGVTSDISNSKSVCPEGQFGTLGTPCPERAKVPTGHFNTPSAGVPSLREGRDTRAEDDLAGTPTVPPAPPEFDETQAGTWDEDAEP